MDYRGDLTEQSRHDLWVSAIDRAFDAYNQPEPSPEDQHACVESLPNPLRYALVCFLYEAEINNGGMDLVFSCIGLLVPHIIAGLSYFGLEDQCALLSGVVSKLSFGEFPRSYDALMAAWDAWSTGAGADYIGDIEARYFALATDRSLRSQVESRIDGEPQLFFRIVESTFE